MHMFASLLWLECLALADQVITESAPLVDIAASAVYEDVVMVLAACKITLPDGTEFHSRCFNGTIPGPTIRTHAGKTLRVKVINDLGPHPSDYIHTHNTFSSPNTTNLHTHGLHVTANSPADDVFVHVDPGESFQFEYDLPDYHMSGTHWYHPHHHGSTSVQAGGGAHGMLIVDELAGEVPPEISSMTEVLLVLSYFTPNSLKTIETESEGGLWEFDGDLEDQVLVNGHLTPTIAMTTNKWYRWRTLYASVEAAVRMAFESANCEMKLLSKDGVFLPFAPRSISVIPFPLGGRADVAVRCSVAGTYSVGSGARRRRMQGKGGKAPPPVGGGGPMGGGAAGDFSGTLFSVVVTDGGVTATDIPTFAVTRPCYLADLTCANTDQLDRTFDVGLRPFSVNNQQFVDSDTPLADSDFNVGTISQWVITGTGGHPFHLHVNPYQIQSVSTTDPDYFQVGDWHDVVLGPTALTVRIQFDIFVTKAVIHCHVLEHEDQGMMGFTTIKGTEGTVWAGGPVIDPTCYTDASRGYAYANSKPACGTGVVDVVTAAPSVVVGNGNSCPAGYSKIKNPAACVASLDILGPGNDDVDDAAYSAYSYNGVEDASPQWPSGCYECWDMAGCTDGVWFNPHPTGAANGGAKPICAKGLEPLQQGKVLWMGDSDTDYWPSTASLAPGSHNVAVGGDTCLDVLEDLPGMLLAFKPSTVVITCGENDIGGDTTGAVVAERFKRVAETIIESGARVIVFGTKDEPNTTAYWEEYAVYDAQVSALAASMMKNGKAMLAMVDANAGFKAVGNPEELYAADGLHLSPEGYALWDRWAISALMDATCAVWLSGQCQLKAEPVNPTEEEEGFDFGSGCLAGNGSFSVNLRVEQATQDLPGFIPAGKYGVKVNLTAEVDIDIQLLDMENTAQYLEGAAIVAYCEPEVEGGTCNNGPLGTAPGVDSIDYFRAGMSDSLRVTYSGYNGVTSLGDEYITITGATPISTKMRVYAYKTGPASVTYSWERSESACCTGQESCPGEPFTKSIIEGELAVIGVIPANKKNVRISLTSTEDVDVQIYDMSDISAYEEGKAIIGYCTPPEGSTTCNGGVLNGPNREEHTLGGVTYVYSGYNGVDGKLGNEYIELLGTTDRALLMKAYGYTKGVANVTYSWYELNE